MRDLFFEPGEAALRRRVNAMKLMEVEPDRDPDLFVLGPDAPCDDTVKARFYGED